MLPISMSQTKRWSKVQHGAQLAPTAIDSDCPNRECRKSLIGNHLKWISQNGFVCAGTSCRGCDLRITFFLMNPPKEKPDVLADIALYAYPVTLLPPEPRPGVSEVSPMFVEIYAQAFAAERYDLAHIAGVGYRKALEFLIKDFLKQQSPSEADVIEGKFLGKCISDHVDDPMLKTTAERAAWLGNDEAHYTRVHVDHTIDDLKILIKLTEHWISSHHLTKGFGASLSRGTTAK